MRKRVALILITILVVTISVAAFYRVGESADKPEYMTGLVTRGDVVETVEATGTLRAVTTVQVGTQLSGTIQSLSADFNSRVRKGQVIARLDSSLLQAEVEQAEAGIVRLQAEVDRARVDLGDAQVKLERARELSAKGLIPRADLDTAESTARQAEASLQAAQAQVTQARAALNQNRVNLSHAVITAPIDGIVISRNVDVGQTVAASMSAPTLFVIAKDLTQMQVEANIDEADIGRIQPGQHVTFRVDAYPQDVFRGTVQEVRLDPVVVQNVVSYVTVIDVPNVDGKLKPGMTATVTVEIARADDVLTVPNAALRFRPAATATSSGDDGTSAAAGVVRADGGRRVWALQQGRVQPVSVRTGISNGAVTAIVDGQLRENMAVVTGVAEMNAPSTPSGGSPLIPQRLRGNRQAAGRQGAAGGGR